ncbi:hypothetical protein [Amycolatopsis sp. lyj-23]|uniref:DUF4760 domain-containing protein n=1 Tax=Amycolatopsis sp. lyj-23 TaxID=2789283 RepID=UPI00397D8375
MKIEVIFAAISVATSLFALGIAALSTRRQWRSARNANAVSSILTLFEEYRTEDLRVARRLVFKLAEYPTDLNPTLTQLPADTRVAAERVAHYFDHVGLLVGYSLIPAGPMISFFGYGCTELWKKLEPYVAAERRLRGVNHYLGYFEGFARVAREVDADALNGKVVKNMRSRGVTMR